jgi:hypothetical protein
MRVTARKAIAGAIGAFAAGIGTALVSDGAITMQEAGAALGVALLAGAAVWNVKYQVTAN